MTSLGRLWHNPMRKEADPLQCSRYAIGFMRRGRFLEWDLRIGWRVKQDEEEYKERKKTGSESYSLMHRAYRHKFRVCAD